MPGAALHVVVCDDNRDAADSMGRLLELLGARTTVVHDGESALQTVARDVPALVVMDLGMPDVDGFEVARRLNAMPQRHALLLAALTGWGQPADVERTRSAGFDRHLVKPVEIGALLELLEAAAASRRPARER